MDKAINSWHHVTMDEIKSHAFGINHDKRTRLREMNVFVLDNSLRESTVAQTAGHTLHNKIEILDEIKKCGFDNLLVGAFGGMLEKDRRVDDAFCENLGDHLNRADMADAWNYAFTDISDNMTIVDKQATAVAYGEDNLPAGLQKCQKYGIDSAVIEIDIKFTKTVPMTEVIECLTFLLTWANANFKPLGKSKDRRRHMVNLRDLSVAMMVCPQRALDFVEAVAKLPKEIRPSGILFEESLGEYFGDEVANWTSAIRNVMDRNDWKSEFQRNAESCDGMLLYHVHEEYGLANATVLDALAAGADGMWCGLSEEGAPMGHACSAVALTNLYRLGNEYVKAKYNTKNLVNAARKVSIATTGKPVPSKQIVYGSAAEDVCFSFSSINHGKREDDVDYDGNGVVNDYDKFSIATTLIGMNDQPVRVSTLASSDMITTRLKQCFGDNTCFSDVRSQELLVEIKRRLMNNIKEEYMQIPQLGKLWNDVFPDDSLQWSNDD